VVLVCVAAPTDLTVKKDSPSHSASSSSSTAAAAGGESAAGGLTEARLDAAEVSAIRQLIAGYRESAAFLSRSADELQQLILHQNN